MKRICLLLLISICIFSVFYTSAVYADGDIDKTRDKIDSQVTKIVKIIGYVIILIVGIKEVIQEAQNGDLKGVGSVFVKYLIIYAVLLGFPVGLKWVETFIEGLK